MPKMRPAVTWFAVTPSDSTEFRPTLRGLWVGAEGNVAVTDIDGNTETFVGVQGLLWVEAVQVMSTNTTAKSILGLR